MPIRTGAAWRVFPAVVEVRASEAMRSGIRDACIHVSRRRAIEGSSYQFLSDHAAVSMQLLAESTHLSDCSPAHAYADNMYTPPFRPANEVQDLLHILGHLAGLVQPAWCIGKAYASII